MTSRPELLESADAIIDDAVQYCDPMVLRGLLYQLTGDESIAATELTDSALGFLQTKALKNPADVAFIQSKAAEFLKSYRDQGASDIPVGPETRLLRSLTLAVGSEIPAAERELWLEQLALDPWARGLKWQERPTAEQLQNFSVAVIGAGMAGLNSAVHLKQAGVSFTVIEKNPAVGGTWYENRYPGARVDSPSRAYTHIYSVDYEFPNPFCEQDENEKYFNWIADHFNLRADIEFDTEVESITWDEAAKTWEISAVGPDGPRTWRANAVISGVGLLSRPNVPNIEGMADFKGPIFHTARWPANLSVEEKRVAVIGTGCTGYQLVPELARPAAHTYIFQRTPSWCFSLPGYLSPYPPQVTWLHRNVPYYSNFERFRIGWLFGPDNFGLAFNVDPDFDDQHTKSELNRTMREQSLEFMLRKFVDRPDLMDKMLPGVPPITSRPVLVDENDSIYDALLRDDVTLVTEGIRRIKAGAIELEDGSECPVDIIAFATGFKANDFLWPMKVRGRDGKDIEELWEKDGARAYLGSMLPGFPNFFMVYGPNTNPAGGFGVVDLQEIETRFALECIAHLILRNQSLVDVTLDAYRRYNEELDREETHKIYSDQRVRNYYKNEHGRSAAMCPFDGRLMWKWLRNPAGAHADSDLLENPDRRVRPYFGEDLIVE